MNLIGRTRLAIAAAALTFAGLAGPAAGAASATPPIKHVWVIVLENKEFGEWYGVGRSYNPYLTSTLTSQGVLIPNYFGIGHSSADNYIGMVSGQPPTADSKSDCPDPMKTQPATPGLNGVAPGNGCVYPPVYKTIGDQLDAADLSWKAYAESIPSACSPVHDAPGSYERKHNPFPYFQSVVQSGSCKRNDVPLTQLPDDLSEHDQIANVNYIFPNECEDGHSDCTHTNPVPLLGAETSEMGQYDAFLQKWVPAIQATKAYKQGGMIFITFDEGDDPFGCCGEPAQDPDGTYPGGEAGSPGTGGGQVGAVALSPFITPGTTSTSVYNHYSLLASLEDLFGLSRLGDASLSGVTTFGSDVYSNSPTTATKHRARRSRAR